MWGVLICKQTMLHLRMHELTDGAHLVSLNFDRHIEHLSNEYEVFDELELLEMPVPEPAPETTPVHYAQSHTLPAHHTTVTDALIFKYVQVYGPAWRDLAFSLGGCPFGYGEDVVRDRYFEICHAFRITQPYEPYYHYDTDVGGTKPDRPWRWTDADDSLIADSIYCFGPNWKTISSVFEGRRTTNACRNRAIRLGLFGRHAAGSPEG